MGHLTCAGISSKIELMAHLIVDIRDHIAIITLNRPNAGNCISAELAADLAQACLRINSDSSVYVAVLTATGKDFCTGTELGPGPYHPAAALAAIDRPVIAAISGAAIGEGLELALAADLRLADSTARFSLPQITRGMLPWDGATQRLPRIVGKSKALEMLLTGEPVSAQEAYGLGLVNRLCSDLASETAALAASIGAKGPIAARFIKEAVHKGLDLTLEQGIRLEEDLYFLLHTTADRTEGVRAFLEKRPPHFTGS